MLLNPCIKTTFDPDVVLTRLICAAGLPESVTLQERVNVSVSLTVWIAVLGDIDKPSGPSITKCNENIEYY